MISNSDLEGLRGLLDLLREKRVAHFEFKDLKVRLGDYGDPDEEEEGEEEEDGEPDITITAEEEPVNPATGLTKTQEQELFYSAG